MKNSLNAVIVPMILLYIVFACNPPKDSETNPSSGNTQTTRATPKTAKVNMENFSKLQTGMTYSETVTILGREGELISENSIGGIRTVMYQWEGDKGSYGANMNAIFQDGKLVQKAQAGLK